MKDRTHRPHERAIRDKKALTHEHVLLVVLPILAMSVVCFLFVTCGKENSTVNVYDKSSFNQASSVNVRFEVESVVAVANEGDKLAKGWFVLPGVTHSYYNYGNDANRNGVYNNVNVCLIEGDKVYVLPTKLELRDDVNQMINDGIDYRYSGFQANIPKEYSHLASNDSFAFLTKSPDGFETLYVQDGKNE